MLDVFQGFTAQQSAKFSEKTYAISCEDRFYNKKPQSDCRKADQEERFFDKLNL